MSTIPQPSKNELEQSHALVKLIQHDIQANHGKISFCDYMNKALYAPELGYYRNSTEKFGVRGDFITAPSACPIFSMTLANQCADIIQSIGPECAILEFGPGNGALAQHLMQSLHDRDCLPAQYYLMEPAAKLRAQQQDLLRSPSLPFQDKFHWLTELPQKPFTGIIIANEVLDAMPVHRFQIAANGGIEQSYVTIGNECLQESFATPEDNLFSQQLDSTLTQLPHRLPSQYRSEINTYLPGWLSSLWQLLARGVVLLIDYGFPAHEYYHPARSDGTLMCHIKHRSHPNPFLYPGCQDITAHVDFTAVARTAAELGFTISGFTTQGLFLIASGLEQAMQDLSGEGGDTRAHLDLMKQIKLLTHPEEMGELFKVMALSKEFTSPLRGFSLRDMRARL